MKQLFLLFTVLFSVLSFAGFEGLNDNTSLKIFNRINCDLGLDCSRTNKGTFNISVDGAGVIVDQVVASATTITASQCGSTFINAAAVQMELPEASSVLGCRLTFVTGNASNFDVNPDDADQILIETDAVGDAIRNATLGNSITLEAISASQWTLISVSGTYTDIN